MNIDEEQEVKKIKEDEAIFNIKNESYKNELANKLINGSMGYEIKNTINNPIKITRFKIFKFRFKRLINKIIDSI